ncbi:hypothetical protein CLOM_g20186, partial [Closterium sp. NIES-68]
MPQPTDRKAPESADGGGSGTGGGAGATARAAQGQADEHAELQRLQRQLAPPAGSVPIQGYLLKRSETLHLWNQRWFVLDPLSARMEYRILRSDSHARGTIHFEADSTITVSPINLHGAKQYENCCF